MLAVRPFHIPIVWSFGREQDVNRLEGSIRGLGVNCPDEMISMTFAIILVRSSQLTQINNRYPQQIKPGEEKVSPVL